MRARHRGGVPPCAATTATAALAPIPGLAEAVGTHSVVVMGCLFSMVCMLMMVQPQAAGLAVICYRSTRVPGSMVGPPSIMATSKCMVSA